jgi:hypothetical protein
MDLFSPPFCGTLKLLELVFFENLGPVAPANLSASGGREQIAHDRLPTFLFTAKDGPRARREDLTRLFTAIWFNFASFAFFAVKIRSFSLASRKHCGLACYVIRNHVLPSHQSNRVAPGRTQSKYNFARIFVYRDFAFLIRRNRG